MSLKDMTPPNREQFVQQVLEVVKDKFPDAKVARAQQPFSLRIYGQVDSLENNIITIEDPVEYRMNNVTQIEINTKAGQTFGGSLRSVLRQDPDLDVPRPPARTVRRQLPAGR